MDRYSINYQCWYNVPAGAIIVDLAWSPSYKMKEMQEADKRPERGQLLNIRQLSDVMWIEWASQASDPSALKYIFQMNVVNLDIRDVIEEAIALATAAHAEAAEIEYWEFDLSTASGQALLGTPNGNPQVWILINHKMHLVRTRRAIEILILRAGIYPKLEEVKLPWCFKTRPLSQ
jgi:hypothetical protein